jgi:hypothetical protein
LLRYDLGNLKDLFRDFYLLPSNLHDVFKGIRFINYNSDKIDPLPSEIRTVKDSFTAENSTGNPTLQQLFTRNNQNKFEITSIAGSF